MSFGSGEGFTPGRHNLDGDFTVDGNISASAAISGGFFFGDGSFLQNVTGSGGGGGGISFNGSTANGILTYGNASTADVESNLTFNGTLLGVGGASPASISASSGLTASSLQISDGSRHYGMTNEGNLAIATLSASSNLTGSTLKLEHGLTASSVFVGGPMGSVVAESGSALYVSGAITGSGGICIQGAAPRVALQMSSAMDAHTAIQFWKGDRNTHGKWMNLYAREWRHPTGRTNNADGRIEIKIPHIDLPAPGADVIGDHGFLFHNAQTSSYLKFLVECTTSNDYQSFGFNDRENSATPALRFYGNGKFEIDCGNVDLDGTYAGTSSPAKADNQFILKAEQMNFGTASNCTMNVTGGIRVTAGTGDHTVAGYVSASTGLTASSLQISDGSRHYGMTNEGILGIASFGADWTNAGNTIANLGTVTTATSITATDLIGTNIDGIIGADTARAGTFTTIVGTSLNVSEGNITNVGDINCDSVSVDDAAVGLDIQMGGNTGLNKITLTDGLADALNITEGSNSYLKFTTTNSSEQIVVGQNSTFAGTTIANLGTVTTATSITATDLIGTNIDGIIGADTARAGTFTTIVGTSLNVSDGDITNVGDINCDSISVDDAAVGLDIQMGGTTGLNKITLTDDLADALNITEGSNSYMKFTTSNGSEEIVLSKNVDCEGDFGVDGNVTLGNDDGDAVTLKGVPSIVGVSDTSPADLYFKADQSGGDEDIDNWLVRAADGGQLSINNKASSGYVAQMTLYPHATQASSLTKVEGQFVAGTALLVGQPNAPTNTGTTTSNSLTIANLLTRIIHNTNGASGGITYTLPTAADIVAGLTSAIGNTVAGLTFDFSVINTDASQGITVATNTGLTTVGGLTVDVGDSATFRVYITSHAGSSEAATVYRIS